MAGIREKRVPVFYARLPSFQNFAIILSKKCNLPARNGAYQGEGLQYKMRGDDFLGKMELIEPTYDGRFNG